MNHTLAAALLMGLSSGTLRQPKSCTSGNRIHTERAPRGSPEHLRALADAEAKRVRKAAKRAGK